MESIFKTVAQLNEDFNKRMAAFESKLQKDDSPTPTTASLSADFLMFKNFTAQSLSNLHTQLEMMVRNMDNLEVRRRRKILLLHGVTEEKTENLNLVVSDIIKNQFKFDDFSAGDLKRCQRLGRFAATQKARPILFKVRDVTVRDKIWFSKVKLKGSGITISEFLTKNRHDLFMAAREKLGINRCWTKQGNIYIVGSDGKHHRLSSLLELNKVQEIPEKPPTTTKAATTKTKRVAATRK